MNRRTKRVRVSWVAGALLPLLGGIGTADMKAALPRTNQPMPQNQPAVPQMVAALPYGYGYNPYGVTTLQGTVLQVITGHVPGTSPAQDEIGLLVRAANGMKVQVDLGPRSFVESQGIYLPPGTPVTITGSPTQAAGKYIFLSWLIQTPNGVFRLRTPNGTPYWNLNRPPYPNYDYRGYGRYDRYAYPYGY